MTIKLSKNKGGKRIIEIIALRYNKMEIGFKAMAITAKGREVIPNLRAVDAERLAYLLFLIFSTVHPPLLF